VITGATYSSGDSRQAVLANWKAKMGNKLLVTFESNWNDDATYNRLYHALVEAVSEGRAGNQLWTDTTAFFIVDTNENSTGFAERVWSAARLRPDKDKLVVLNMNGQGGVARGAISDEAIFSLLPFVKNEAWT
jgi:hypothetical protein